jgi:AraC-like DNA-binding protein
MAAQRDPIREWREQYARRCHHIDFEPSTDAPIRASLNPIFDGPYMVRATLSPGFLFRDEDLVRDGDDSLSLLISQSRELNLTHRGRELRLGPGDATIMQASAPGSAGSRESFGFVEVIIPPADWESRDAHSGDALMRRLWRKSGAVQLLRAYIRSLERTAVAVSVDGRALVRRHVIDLAVLAATTRCSIGESSVSAVVAARRATALDHIRSSFEDPELSLESAARHLRISPRYLQRLLETSGTSFTARVNELRLQRAFTLLTEARDGERRISDIALQVGFPDISHFNRLFRSRFGDTPRGVRGQRAQ